MNITIIGASGGIGLETVKRGLNRKHSITTLSRSEIEIEEKKSLKKVQFISTNDLLTSWLFTLVKCDVGMMAVNFRNRINDIT